MRIDQHSSEFAKRQLAIILILLLLVICLSQAQAQTVRINSGGPAVMIAGDAWVADMNFTGGSVPTAVSTTIGNTDKVAIYQTNRYRMTGYKIPVTNGDYTLKLHFAEVFFTAAGKRVFNVTAEGQAILTAFDIFKEAGGGNRAVMKSFSITVSDGSLDIGFAPTVDNAQINAIEVIPASAGTLTLSASTTLSESGAIPTLTWTTTPAANRCEAAGAWSGPKSPGDSEILPAITASTTYRMTCYWGNTTAPLSWTPPTKNTDGSPLTNLGGFRILYGSAADALTRTIGVPGAGVREYVVRDLSPGKWYFGLKAFNTTGQESDISAVVSTTLGETSLERALEVVVNPNPNPPTDIKVEPVQ